MLIARTPFRISLFGGGSDYPKHFTKHGGACLNIAINKYCYLTYRTLAQSFGPNYRIRYTKSESVESLDEISHPAVKALLKHYRISKPTEINHSSDLPAQTGIGSSSAFIVGLLSILDNLAKRNLNNYDLAKKAIFIEQEILKETVGYQDAIVSTFGGVNLIEFKKDKNFKISRLNISTNYLDSIVENLILIKVGKLRHASNIASEQVTKMHNHVKDLSTLADLARSTSEMLIKESLDLGQVANLLDLAWKIKAKQSKMITNQITDDFYDYAKKSGALGGKLCGAGGGGFFLLVVPRKIQKKFKENFSKSLIINFGVDFTGNKLQNIFL